ncbi:serine hydrolase domain-containing protein [Cyclobacterium sp. 1_MG-2023]|uniref:serine hydrolase domain-containing protein n=1 Tax=Cyclobacterium sp. 1_MG-2023 TaxID=3062681 RepID=UPI0026E1E03C|nr:serine hydrolase domain-containing protein [Cyclobacterium sp. 1_MG-2023]MDO6439562.1 serine hydrolase domain-containing protein [Cyclobacterium sp. 1_MG-2023]
MLILSMVVAIQGCGNPEAKRSKSQVIETETLPEDQYELILDKVKALPNQAELAIAIIENWKVNFVGVKREQDSTVFLQNKDKVFEIGSITKVFTGTLLANYLVEGEVNLEDQIDKYLGYSLKEDVKITLKQLATHSSGLPRVPASLEALSLENPYKDFGEEELKTYLTHDLRMKHKPGEVSDYSNLGVGLLGYVLSNKAQMTYEEMLQKEIFSKYGMNASTTIRSKVEDKLVIGLNDKGEEVSNWDMSVLMGAGGILSSVKDMSKFALAQFDSLNRELVLSRTAFFEVTENYSMALGWSVIQTESGAVWNWHNGGTGGYTSSMIIDVKAKNGVIILSNISALGELTNTITSLAPALMDDIKGEEIDSDSK